MSRRWPRSLGITWLLAFVGFFLVGAISSLGAPPTSASDESNHVVRAVSLDAGQLLGPQAPHLEQAEILVTVPQTWVALERSPKCFQLHVDRSASCAPRLVGSSRLVKTTTYVGRYPPTYYAVVGLPSVLSSSPGVLYAMRLLSMALSAALLGLAVALALVFGAGTALAGGVLLAVTPEVLYDGSIVQPSGFEMSSGICLWTAAVLLLWRSEQRPVARAVVSAAGASGTALVLSRNISPFWFLLIVLVVLAGATRGTFRQLLARRDARIWAAVVLAAALFEVGWDLYARPFELYVHHHPIPSSVWQAAWGAIRLIPRWSVQAVSNFGFRSDLAPIVTYLVVAAAVSVAVAVGLWKGSGRRRLAIVASIVGSALVPVVLLTVESRSYGYIWAGRYSMPFAVGIPITAAAATRLRRRSPRSIVRGFAGCWGIVTVTSLWAELRRFSVGDKGPLDLLATFHPAWQPPLTLPVLALAAVLLSAAMVAFVSVGTRGEEAPGP